MHLFKVSTGGCRDISCPQCRSGYRIETTHDRSIIRIGEFDATCENCQYVIHVTVPTPKYKAR